MSNGRRKKEWKKKGTSDWSQLVELDDLDGDALRGGQERECDQGVALVLRAGGAQVARQRDPFARLQGVAQLAEVNADPS